MTRTDVLLVALDPGTAVAGVFTKSKCPSAPVEWCRDKLAGFKRPRAITFLEPGEMPRNTTGKILHRVLRDMLAARTRVPLTGYALLQGASEGLLSSLGGLWNTSK